MNRWMRPVRTPTAWVRIIGAGVIAGTTTGVIIRRGSAPDGDSDVLAAGFLVRWGCGFDFRRGVEHRFTDRLGITGFVSAGSPGKSQCIQARY